jgi:hypothetical protein
MSSLLHAEWKAVSSAAMSIFFICIIAFRARDAAAASGLLNSRGSNVGKLIRLVLKGNILVQAHTSAVQIVLSRLVRPHARDALPQKSDPVRAEVSADIFQHLCLFLSPARAEGDVAQQLGTCQRCSDRRPR